MQDEFLISEDKDRGVKTVGWFNAEGLMQWETRQYVSDAFFAQVATLRDKAANAPKLGSQNHHRHVMEIPTVLANKLLVDGNGIPYAMNDPEREKAMKRLMNDIDYRDLRIHGGRV